MKKIITIIFAIIMMSMLTVSVSAATLTDQEMLSIYGAGGGKGGSGGGGTYTPVDPDGLTSTEFYNQYADNTIYFWEGEDYTAGGNGDYGIDGAATVVETLYDMGYDLPVTTADGLYNNYYNDEYGTEWTEWYTQSNGVSDWDLENQNYSVLEKGDLIFLDYDFDYVFDHVATYVGYYQGIENAVLTASDYYDEVVVADLDNYNDPFAQDLEWSNVSSKELDYFSIEDNY